MSNAGHSQPGDTSYSNPRRAILISQELWERRYGADPTIIGRLINITRGERRVVGVLPRAFDFPSASVSMWYPATVPVGRPSITARGYTVIGRLRNGSDIDAAKADEGAALFGSMLDEFDRICGLPSLRVLHLNDSLGLRGSNIDRHAHIGAGHVAAGAFAGIVSLGVGILNAASMTY